MLLLLIDLLPMLVFVVVVIVGGGDIVEIGDAVITFVAFVGDNNSCCVQHKTKDVEFRGEEEVVEGRRSMCVCYIITFF